MCQDFCVGVGFVWYVVRGEKPIVIASVRTEKDCHQFRQEPGTSVCLWGLAAGQSWTNESKFRKREKCYTRESGRDNSEKQTETTQQTPTSLQKEGRRCFNHQSTVFLHLMVCHVRENIQACGEPLTGEGPGLELQLVVRRTRWGQEGCRSCHPWGSVWEECSPKGWSCGIESCCSSAWRTSVCGKPKQDQLGRTANCMEKGKRVRMKQQQVMKCYGLISTPIPCLH